MPRQHKMPQQAFLAALQQGAREVGLQPHRGPVVVGLSGGADSLALAHGLARLGYPIVAAHLDHGLRPESAAQAQAVRAWAQAQGWPTAVARADVQGRARRERISLEDAARRERYAFLFRVAEAHHAQAVATAHTQDDLAETVLLRLLRGAGVEGLRAMQPRTVPTPWHPRIPLVRPLLAVPRAVVHGYTQALDLPVQPDPSNQDPRFLRNRVRHQLLPLMAQLNPRVVETLARTARVLAAEAEILAQAEQQAWEATVLRATPEAVQLHPQAWPQLLPGLRYRLLRRAARHLLLAPPTGTAPPATARPFWWQPSWRAVQRADQVLRQAAAPRPQPWVAGLYLLTRPDGLFVLRGPHTPPGPWPQLPAGSPLPLEPGQTQALAHGWQVQASALIPAHEARAALQASPPGPWEAYLDPDAAPPPWHLTPPRPGDRFAPLGLGGHTLTVGDAFTNRKIPLSLRPRWPLLRTSDQRIAWFPGYGPAHWARLTPASRHAVRVRILPPEEHAP